MDSTQLKYARYGANVFVISVGLICLWGKFPVAFGIDLNGYIPAAGFILLGFLGFLGVNVYYGGPLDMRLDRKVNAAPKPVVAATHVVQPYLDARQESEYREYLRSHPPAYIRHLVKRTGPDDDSLESHFALECTCGSKEFAVQGCANPGHSWLVSPYAARCKQCGTEHVLLDYEIHGWDGVLNNIPNLGHRADTPVHCPNCSGDVFTLAVLFQYNIEEKKLTDEERPELAPEDLFGWFSATGKCVHCGNENNFADCECA